MIPLMEVSDHKYSGQNIVFFVGRVVVGVAVALLSVII